MRIYEAPSLELATEMSGHSEPVQCCAFDRKGKFLVTAGADSTFRLFC